MSIHRARHHYTGSNRNAELAAAIDSSIVAYWQMEEATGATRTSSVGTFDLADNSTVNQAAGSVSPFCASFDGSDFLSLANASMGALKIATSFSVSFWFKTDSAAGSGENFVSWWNLTGSQRGWQCFWEGTSDTIWFKVSSNGTSTEGTTLATASITSFYGSHSASTWYFWVATYDDTLKQAVLNINAGFKTGSATKSAAGVHQSTADFNVGKDQGGRNIQGDIDQLAVYNKVLSAQEITYLYNSGFGRRYPL